MVCEFKLKGYCFHPKKNDKNFIASNCVYSWINCASRKQFQGSEVLEQ